MKIVVAVFVVIIIGMGAGLGYLLTRPPAEEEPKLVHIGGVWPLSGAFAETGTSIRRGVRMAVDEINSNGGIESLGGKNITFHYGDHAGDPSTGATEARRIIENFDPVLMMGCYHSSVTKTAAGVAEDYKVPHLNGESSSPTLTQLERKWFFRSGPHDGMFNTQQIEFVLHLDETYSDDFEDPLDTFAIIHEDTEFGTATAEDWEEKGTAAGLEHLGTISYHAETVTTLDSEVEQLKSWDPDVVFDASYVSDAKLLVSTMKAKTYMPPVFIAQDAGFIIAGYINAVGEDGYYFMTRQTVNWDLNQSISHLDRVVDDFNKLYGYTPGGAVLRDYAAVKVAALAIEEAGKHADLSDLETFRDEVRKALLNMDIDAPSDAVPMPWEGVKFNQTTHQNIYAAGVICQMMPDDGLYHTVYPTAFATRDPIVPLPGWDER
ncbi:MAG: ABC transporter substrate-binding protein [Candidatus Korarchaeota archaeon]|nr:ABC transporter substrate-binding protein [Candidatus Korarchaeota archaeon]